MVISQILIMFLFHLLSFFKEGDTIQGGDIIQGGHYLRKYSMSQDASVSLSVVLIHEKEIPWVFSEICTGSSNHHFCSASLDISFVMDKLSIIIDSLSITI